MEYREEGVRVGASPHGLGVFALRSFQIHQILGPIRGTIMDDPRYESDYCMAIGPDSALEPSPPFRFMNHSCHPNCALVEMEVDREDSAAIELELWVEVLAEIHPGEQMTIDYAWPAWAAIPCHCGSPDCRGWIVDAAERGKIAQDGGHAGGGQLE